MRFWQRKLITRGVRPSVRPSAAQSTPPTSNNASSVWRVGDRSSKSQLLKGKASVSFRTLRRHRLCIYIYDPPANSAAAAAAAVTDCVCRRGMDMGQFLPRDAMHPRY